MSEIPAMLVIMASVAALGPVAMAAGSLAYHLVAMLP